MHREGRLNRRSAAGPAPESWCRASWRGPCCAVAACCGARVRHHFADGVPGRTTATRAGPAGAGHRRAGRRQPAGRPGRPDPVAAASSWPGAESACIGGAEFFDTPDGETPGDATIRAMRRTWPGANTVRLPLNEQCRLGLQHSSAPWQRAFARRGAVGGGAWLGGRGGSAVGGVVRSGRAVRLRLGGGWRGLGQRADVVRNWRSGRSSAGIVGSATVPSQRSPLCSTTRS